MLKSFAAGKAIEQRQINFDKLLPRSGVAGVGQSNDQTGSCIGNCAHRHAADLARGYILTHAEVRNLSRLEVQMRQILEDNIAEPAFSGTYGAVAITFTIGTFKRLSATGLFE